MVFLYVWLPDMGLKIGTEFTRACQPATQTTKAVQKKCLTNGLMLLTWERMIMLSAGSRL